MTLDLKEDVFQPVLKRMIDRTESLRSVRRFSNVGIEGWFKVEIVAALGDKVISINNTGPDLTLEGQKKIEIKAATSFAKSWCVVDPIQKYKTIPVLFLADGANASKFTSGKNDVFEIVAHEIFSDGMNDWRLGMVKPKS